MTLLIALLLEWKFGLLDFSNDFFHASITLGGTIAIWLAHVYVKIMSTS
jgi:hypothetical protein